MAVAESRVATPLAGRATTLPHRAPGSKLLLSAFPRMLPHRRCINIILHMLPVLVLPNHIGFQVGALCLASTLLSLNLHAHLAYCLDYAHWLFPSRMIENSPMNSSIAFDHLLVLLQCTSEGT